MAKLTKKSKIEIYERRVNGESIKSLSINFVSIDLGLFSSGTLHNWIKNYKEKYSNIIEKKKGRKQKL